MADARYCIEYAKTGRSGCKKCKSTIEKGICRIGKITPNPFSDDGGDMKVWYHARCMFETLQRARVTTKKIESPADLEGFPDLNEPDKDEIKTYIRDFAPKSPAKPKKGTGGGATATQSKLQISSGVVKSSPVKPSASSSAAAINDDDDDDSENKSTSNDDSFLQFEKICQGLEKTASYNAKTKLVADFLDKGSSGSGYTGDVYMLVKLLLPGSGKKRVYNLQNKQIVKILSQIFVCSLDDMIEDLEKGDVAETAKVFYEENGTPAKTSTLTIQDVDKFLDKMADLTREDDQKLELSKIVKKCTSEDLKYIIRLIKHDLRINSGAKHILDALDPNAYSAFQVSHDLKDVVDRVMSKKVGGAKPGLTKNLSIRISLMTPVKPMLAEACRSVAMAMKKCPNGMFAEIKYDGERVQVHKQGTNFQYFSRSLKAVQPHKVAHIKDHLPKACPHGDSMILDSEVLMVDVKTGDPLPFGTLGIHKKTAFKDASCCLVIFDILYFNGKSLLDQPIIERRKLLEENVEEVKNHIMLSETKLVKQPAELSGLITTVIKKGLEGLVLKDTRSIYEPGKRHWLKVKKDYLADGAMADTADLVVLGAYYGTGSKGGLMSVFLMGVYDEANDVFRTVCKCGNGHDDSTIMKLQKELDMVKISKDYSKVPSWLVMNRSLTPDLIIADPKKAPVWEITGAEFSQSSTHTAGGISIRFPRVTRIRDDKDWSTATELERLKTLYKTSKESTDVAVPLTSSEHDNDVEMTAEPTAGQKRAKSQSSAVSLKKHKLAITSPTKEEKSLCKYGIKCYQTSKEHKEKYAHPLMDQMDDDSHTSLGVKIDMPLVDLFTGMKILIDPTVQEAEELKRYLITYDGDVISSADDSSMATHVIATSRQYAVEEDVPDSIPVLMVEWVWDCLKEQKLIQIENYKL